MRIISGSKRGMNLLGPRSPGTRPITDRVKESLFNVLYSRQGPLHGMHVADLFCGTGSLGLEALSRGADAAVFFERDRRAVEVLWKNIDKAGFRDRAAVRQADAYRLGFAAMHARKFDLVFVDPPYSQSADAAVDSPLGRLLQALAEQIVPHGVVVVRTHERTVLLDQYGRLGVVDRRRWGTQAVTLLQTLREIDSKAPSDAG
jgi:16S rRNA (guanine966-N2)-methyltransferase